mmetsp:Transcript_47148/g.100641  ORF Transcript_47148/g.100641 Transcript_47148/m.100641 type:complete len:259 (-) Transcript_47148:80-856(-)
MDTWRLEDDVLIRRGGDHAPRRGRRRLEAFLLRVLDLLLLLRDVSFLLVLRPLEPEELLALKLVELRLDVSDGVGDARDDYGVERVDTAARHLDGLVEDDERRLQRGELDEHVDRLAESCARLGDLLPSLRETRVVEAHRVRLVHRLEHRHLHTSNVVDARLDAFLRRADILDDDGLDVTRGVLNLCKCKVALLEGFAHLVLCLEDRAKEVTQSHRQCIRLLLQKGVALLRADELDLHHLQVLPRREDVQASASAGHR